MSVNLADAKLIVSMTLDDMKQHLKNMNKAVGGKKVDLQLRLLEGLAAGFKLSTDKPDKPAPKRKATESPSSSSKKQKAAPPSGSLSSFLTEPTWTKALGASLSNSNFKAIESFVEDERRQGKVIYPPDEEVFTAFNTTSLDNVKVVIIGQDPYFNPGQGHGLCFSVQKGVKVPPSLNRIYKVLEKTIPGWKHPKHGYLLEWAEQGVLMLNATLTVMQGKANSHAKCGWQSFTDDVIKVINDKCKGVVFFLWGGFAQKKGKIVDGKNHCVLAGPHPSPMSGSAWKETKCFVEANEYLEKNGKSPVDWAVTK